MSVDIESEDIIRLIAQFLKENDYRSALSALEEETTIKLETVESRESFVQLVCDGKWDIVLREIANLKIPPRKLIDLYEHLVIELTEMRELGAARTLLRQTEPMYLLKQRQPDRYLRLEHLLSRSFFDPKEVYGNGQTKEKRRQLIGQALGRQVTVVSPGRLVSLLEDSAKWQQHQGLLPPDAIFDLFKDSATVEKAKSDSFASQIYCTIKFPGKNTYAESAAFSPNGQYLVTGSVDGFIEVWNYMTGKLRKDLKYQAESNMMAMDESVISLNFSRDSEWLVSGSTDGKIAVWRLQTGTCQRRFSPAHSQGVTCVSFNKDGTQVISCSYDKTIKIHTIKSGKLHKEFIGHTSFVNTVQFSHNDSLVYSGASDGVIKIWDATTAECLKSISSNSPAIQSLVSIPKSSDSFVVCAKSPLLYFMKSGEEEMKPLPEGASNFVATVVSPLGDIVYGISEDATLYCYRLETAELLGTTKVCDGEVIGIAGHPLSNTVAVFDDSGHVYLLRS